MKILFVVPRRPWPPFVGQARLAFYRARELRKDGFQVHLFSYGLNNNISQDECIQLSKSFDSITSINLSFLEFLACFLSSVPLFLFAYNPLLAIGFTPARVRKLFKLCLSKGNFSIVHFFSIRSFPLWSIADLGAVPFVVDLIDSMTLNFGKRLIKAPFFLGIFINQEFHRLKRFELNLPSFATCKAYLTVGLNDLINLGLRCDDDFVPRTLDYSHPKLLICPIGVEPFDQLELVQVSSVFPRIIFFGSLSYAPNAEALDWIISNVYNILLDRIPNLNFFVVGSNPSRFVRGLCDKHFSIHLIENPSSIAPYLLGSFASVAPMVSGSGQQFKVLDSLANGVPCVCTSLAAQPLGLADNENVCLADEPTAFANKLVRLYEDPSFSSSISRGGKDFVESRYSWSTSARLLAEIYSS